MSTSTSKNNRGLAGVLVAVMALCLALGGTALAGPSQKAASPGLSKAQVKKIAKKVANKQIKKKAPKLSVKHADSADSATTAASAATAGSAVSAQFAASAGKIGDLEVKKFSKQVVNNGAEIALLSVAGFTIKATCPAEIPNMNGSADGGKLRFQSISAGDTIDQNGTSNLSLAGLTLTSGQDLGSGYAEYSNAAGAVVSVWYGWRSDGGTCFFFGNAIGG